LQLLDYTIKRDFLARIEKDRLGRSYSRFANVTFDEFIIEAGKRSAETLIQFLKELI